MENLLPSVTLTRGGKETISIDTLHLDDKPTTILTTSFTRELLLHLLLLLPLLLSKKYTRDIWRQDCHNIELSILC